MPLLVHKYRVLTLLLAVTTVIALGLPVTAGAEDAESAVKAAFVYNFFKYTEWPANPKQSSHTLCIAGDNSSNSSFAPLDGKTIGGKPLHVRFNVKSEQLKGCDLVFVPEENRQRIPAMLQEVSGLPVLTVSDSPGFSRHGGMIGLVQNGNRLGFEVNLVPANAAGIHFSSQLLKLARSVRGAK